MEKKLGVQLLICLRPQRCDELVWPSSVEPSSFFLDVEKNRNSSFFLKRSISHTPSIQTYYMFINKHQDSK
jgi:hypothetical protein